MSAGSLAVAGVRGHTRRLLATALAIVIGVTFVAVSMLLLNTVSHGVESAVADGVERHDLVLTPDEQSIPTGAVDALREADGVAAVTATAEAGGQVDGRWNLVTTPPTGNGVELLSGRLPEGPDETAVAVTNVELTGVAVGDSLEVSLDGGAPTGTVEVVGVLELGHHPKYAAREALVLTEETLRTWVPDLTYGEARIDLAAGADRAVVDTVVQDLAPGTALRTGPEEAAARARAATGDADILGAILLGFAAVALATTAIVITNTFTIVLAQRSRELALLRCVGATRSQVRRSVLLEALLLGAAASAVGVLLALGLGWAAGAVIGEVNLGMPVSLALQVDALSLAVPWAVGVVVTAVAAWWPTRRATRVAPVAALQPATAPVARSRAGVLRLVLAVLAVGLGAVALVAGASLRSVPIGVAGGLLSFSGILLAAVVVVPASVRALGAPARAAGVPGRLAVEHAVANPSRAAATSAALLVGVTLITMTSVGAASAALTAEQAIDTQYPADLVVLTPTEFDESEDTSRVVPLEQAVADRLTGLEAVAATAPLTGSVVRVELGPDLASEDVVVAGDPDAVGQVLHDPSLAEALRPGTLGASPDLLTAYGLEPGDEVTVSGPDGETTATVAPFGLDWTMIAHPDVLAEVDANAPLAGMLLQLTEGVDVAEAMTQVKEVGVESDLYVDGAAAVREAMNGILRVLVIVATALLGVAVVIAVIGIANTLSLSVLERTREHALLRALGLTRGQLRATLATEGVLVAVVSAVLGILLGIGYAWAGVQALLPGDVTARVDLPAGPLSVVIGLAVLAGLLASVLPARRAARTAPAAGLALP